MSFHNPRKGAPLQELFQIGRGGGCGGSKLRAGVNRRVGAFCLFLRGFIPLRLLGRSTAEFASRVGGASGIALASAVPHAGRQ
jgi:hypothetical protein